MVPRGAFTEWLVGVLSVGMGVPVGDHESPDDVGWTQGQPNVGEFVPYGVLVTRQASPVQGSLRDGCWDFNLGYDVRVWAPLRSTVDELLLRAGTTVVDQRVVQLPAVGWKAGFVRLDSLSPVISNKQFDPKLYSGSVSFNVFATR